MHIQNNEKVEATDWIPNDNCLDKSSLIPEIIFNPAEARDTSRLGILAKIANCFCCSVYFENVPSIV